MESLYEVVKQKLEEKKKTFNDILYITANRKEKWDMNSPPDKKFNITVEDFIEVSKSVEPVHIADGLRIVGDGFYLTTDTMSGYIKYVKIPSKRKETIYAAKELLLYPEERAAYLLGLEIADKDN